jgi:antitoxin VapB
MMRTAKLFKNGQSQAVRLPKEFRLGGTQVFVKKEGNNIVLMPIETAWWESLAESLSEFSDDFMKTRNQPKKL